MPNVIDLFAGPGGLAEGFSSIIDGGIRRFNIRLSIEKESAPFKTLRLRAFFRKFEPGQVPKEYYDLLSGRIKCEELYEAYPQQSAESHAEVLQVTLGEYSHLDLDNRIANSIGGDANWILIGGPPCQAYSTAGMVGNRTKKGYSPTKDRRFFLYKEYLRIVATHAPAIFVMENVKGLLMAKSREKSIIHEVIAGLLNLDKFMLREFSKLANLPRYRLFSLKGEEVTAEGNPKVFLVHCEKYGIPQSRHRIIIIGIREDIAPTLFSQPEYTQLTCIDDVIGNLPSLRSAISGEKDTLTLWRNNLVAISRCGWLDEAETLHGSNLGNFIRYTIRQIRKTTLKTGSEWADILAPTNSNTEWYNDAMTQGICHHAARPHILTDLHRYFFCSCFGQVFGRSPKMHEFPEQLLPKHENARSGHFKDRFRVQLSNKPGSTIISHMAKDGHAFIHPDPLQCRSLTPREAARIQTFPDNYFFFGGRSQQFRQIGNAVPPLLARIIAEAIYPMVLIPEQI